VLDLLEDLKQRLSLAMLFITHDLRVAATICDRIAVMHRGAIVEMRGTADLFAAPEHAYTRTLLAAVPGGARALSRAGPGQANLGRRDKFFGRDCPVRILRVQ
jgi:ABC-type oligopeptide transport system ATPase subunit